MFDSELSKKFIEKIETLSFEEIDERASHAPDVGMGKILEALDPSGKYKEEV